MSLVLIMAVEKLWEWIMMGFMHSLISLLFFPRRQHYHISRREWRERGESSKSPFFKPKILRRYFCWSWLNWKMMITLQHRLFLSRFSVGRKATFFLLTSRVSGSAKTSFNFVQFIVVPLGSKAPPKSSSSLSMSFSLRFSSASGIRNEFAINNAGCKNGGEWRLCGRHEIVDGMANRQLSNDVSRKNICFQIFRLNFT